MLNYDLLKWYQENARVLPWRSDPQPYRTWISEVMLQQTQVDTVLPYYTHWLEVFPDIPSLAAADEQQVLNLWEGLGYYSRARNIHKTARLLMQHYSGELPGNPQELLTLPGIGPYIANAIASIAFGVDVLAVDGNIRRVVSRVFDVDEQVGTPAFEQQVIAFEHQHLPSGKASEFNQALMDLGSAICTPRNPQCLLCPIAKHCKAFINGSQEARPVKKPRPTVPHYLVTAAVIVKDDQVLIARRPADGLLGGLWEFPGGKRNESDENLPGCLVREIQEELGCQVKVENPFGVYKHAYTHFRITLHAFLCSLKDGDTPQLLHHQDLVWVTASQLTEYPMGKVDRLIASRLQDDGNES